ncbi:MAG: [NiFe]-hydrogenase assembly, chaperone, HybE [Betaproteobacteria bacterium]|nr:MAG: [NiFe]-hydrogenase assembly, chaperone, HybE [Betaproteobacteria bacterium]
MTEPRHPDPSPRLEAAFERIRKTRMEGLPFLNPKLRVEAVGFRPWQGEWLGALVTPWFVNLVLMPGDGPWTTLPEGDERFVTLPAGRFRFICGRDGELGEYHACSLFSPAQQFEDHATARAVAAASLEALFDAGNDEKERAAGAAPPSAVSKRDFLRGRFSGSGDVPRG